MKELSLISTPSESLVHKKIKLFIFESINENNNTLIEKSMEKYFGKRFADVYFKFLDGKEVVVEIQHSKISVKEIKKRTEDYNKKGIYVLWILHGQGTCVASPKNNKDEKEVKISPAESILHKIYGGRVYYINFTHSIPITFALHYSKLLNKKKQGMFKFGYSSFFYRRSNFTEISNLTLLCTEFSGYKIARFFDKNIKSELKEKLLSFNRVLSQNIKDNLIDKKTLRKILKKFELKYGKYMIYSGLIDLVSEKKLKMDKDLNRKITRKLM